jgi:Zn-finger nucleic acid-binding protein
MKCPTCTDSTLSMTDRQGVEIDFCPQCRGIWLDRGELDKLLERAATAMPTVEETKPSTRRRPPGLHERSDFDDSDFRSNQGYSQGQYPRRKKSWLNEIFD